MSPLPSSLKPRHVMMIGLGGAIGAGLFVGSSSSIAQTGPAVLLSFLATSVLVMIVMKMLGEMVILEPGRGSFVSYIRAGHGAWAGFVSGWLYWFFWATVIGSEAIAGAILLHDWMPVPVWVLSILIVSVLFCLNLGAVSIFGEAEFWLSLIKVGAIVLFILASLGYLALHHEALGYPGHLSRDALFPKGLVPVLTTVPSALFTMLGAELGTVAAAETDASEKAIARVTRGIGLRISVFYLVSLLLILLIVPWQLIIPGHSPFIATMERIGIPGSALLMRFVVLTAILSCLNSSMFITSRVLTELACNEDAPRLMRFRTRHGTPAAALAASTLFGMVVAFSSILSPDRIFSFFVNCSGGVVLIVYAMIATAHLHLRMHNMLPRRSLVIGNPVVIAGVVLIFVAMLFQPDQRIVAMSSLGTAAFLLMIAALRRK